MTFTNQKILVTGATGLVGSNLLSRLLAEGASVRATLHRRLAVIADSRIEYVEADLTRGDDCRRAVEGQRYVCMCAGSTFGAGQMQSHPLLLVTPNAMMNSQMLQAAYDAGVEKFLWLSSTVVYPPSGDRPVSEDDPLAGEPFEKYYIGGWMKRFGEVLCRIYGEKLDRRMTTLVLRPSNLYGPHDKFDPASSHVTAALIRRVVARENPLAIWGTGDDVRDLVYVDDMVEAIVRALERLDSFTVLNVGLGRGHSVKQILQMVLELDGYTGARVTFDPSKPTTIPMRLVDVSKTERLLGFRPAIDLREGLRRTIAWYRETHR